MGMNYNFALNEKHIVLNLTANEVTTYDMDGNMITLLPVKREDFPDSFMEEKVFYLVGENQTLSDLPEEDCVVVKDKEPSSGRNGIPFFRLVRKNVLDVNGRRAIVSLDFVQNYDLFDPKHLCFFKAN
jgi:hypothetical protein